MTDRQPRLLSYTEIETALTCWARWDFAYGGRLAGATLKRRELAPILSGGRAWGAAVAAWHAGQGTLFPEFDAHQALNASLDNDVDDMKERGFTPSTESVLELQTHLAACLDHYMTTATPLPNLTLLEHESRVPLPARGNSGRSSTVYRLQTFLDGFTVIGPDHPEYPEGQYVVEFKFRGRLTPVPIVQRQRQHPWYAWGLRRAQNGYGVDGTLVDERLSEAPKPPNLNKPRPTKKNPNPNPPVSHAKDQLCTADDYIAVCHEFGEDPHWDVVENLRARRWQQRVPIFYGPGDLERAGDELRDAAKLIRDLDRGDLTPIRNATTQHCQGCRFRDVCSEPTDQLFVDTLFERTVPKRLRDPNEMKEPVAA